jgi:phenylacetate-CoA ligase
LSKGLIQLFDRVSGNFALKLLSFLRKIEYDQSRIKRFKRTMLKSLLQFAHSSVPYYRDIFRRTGLNPRYDDPFSVLSKMPFLTKDSVRSRFDQLVSNVPSKFWVVQTSGSSGVPLRVLKGKVAEGFGQASFYEGLMWYGYDLGDPVVQLWGRRPVLTRRERIGRFRDRAKNFFEFDAHSMSDSIMKAYFKRFCRIRPEVLYGYVSSIELMCNYMKENGLKAQIPAVVTTAETLLSYQRNLFSSKIGKEVFNQYGCSEITSVAFECPLHGCLHVMPKVILEVVGDDGEAVGAGETGRIVLTDLTNFKMPFIRYEIGDVATEVEDAICSCGRMLPSIEKVQGRTTDVIVGLNGNRVYGEFFTHLFESSGFVSKFGLAQFQVVQRTREFFLIKMKVSTEPGDKDLAYLDDFITSYLGPVKTEYKFLAEIPLLSSGKRRFTVSELT